jgi:hypothetical protein
MSAPAFLGQVFQCRRLLRLRRQLKDEVQKPSPLWRFLRLFLPWAIIPVLALPWWDLVGISFWFGAIPLAVAMLVGVAPPHSPLGLTTFEALRMPSRRALYVARLLPWLPWWLWGGLCGTLSVLLSRQGLIQDWAQAASYLLIGAQLPWLLLGLMGLGSLVQKRWAITGVVSIYLIIAVVSGVLAGFGLGQWLAPFLFLVPLLMLLLEIGLLILQFWLLDRVEPMSRISQLHELSRMPEWQRQALGAKTPKRPVPGELGPALWLGGRCGLGWAAAAYAVLKVQNGGLRGLLARVAPLSFFLIWLALPRGADSEFWAWIFVLYMFQFLVAGSVLHVGTPQRLYLFGVDYRSQLLHRFKTFWITPALLLFPACSLVLWRDLEMPLAMLALVAGLTLFREGCFGWPILEGAFLRMAGCLSLVALLLILGLWLGFLIGIRQLGWGMATRVELFAAPCAVFGLSGILYKWWRLDEDALAKLVQNAPKPVTVVQSPS